MSPRRMAPALHSFVTLAAQAYPDDAGAVAAAAELRALLAVARAAAKVAVCDKHGTRVGDDAPPLDYWQPLQKMHGALERLRRVSSRGALRERRSP